MFATKKKNDSASTARPNDNAPKRGPGVARVAKKQQLIQLLGKKAGADIATLSAKVRLAEAHDTGGSERFEEGRI